MNRSLLTTLLVTCLVAGTTGNAAANPELLQQYRAAGATDFDASTAALDWLREVTPGAGKTPRTCATCHGDDLRQPGKHIKTGKLIEPLAPSANPQRLADARKVEKWFKRNCRWTWGRECTAQEKGNFIQFISHQ